MGLSVQIEFSTKSMRCFPEVMIYNRNPERWAEKAEELEKEKCREERKSKPLEVEKKH